MREVFGSLGRGVYRRKGAVLWAWVVVLVANLYGALRLPSMLLGGSGAIEHSPSERVASTLSRDFHSPLAQPAVVALESRRHTVSDAVFRGWIEAACRDLGRLAFVRQTASYLDHPDPRFRSANGHETMILVGLRARTMGAEERLIPRLRESLRALGRQVRRQDPSAKLAVTGAAATTYDLNHHNETDGRIAELRALPLTAGILLLAFGAPLPAALPVAVAISALTVTLGLVFWLAHLVALSNLLENIVSIIGLAVGIDYALLMVERFRAARQESPPETAVVEAMASAGPAILASGATVMLGLLAMLLSPLRELRSIGIGGAIVVAVAVLAALTLLPALLGLLVHRLDSVRSGLLTSAPARRRWHELAEKVVRHPRKTLALALVLVAALGWPVFRLDVGIPDSNWLPASMPSQVGIAILAKMDRGNFAFPLTLIVRSRGGGPVLAVRHLPALVALAQRLENDPRVGEVLCPVTLAGPADLLETLAFYHDPTRALALHPEIAAWFLSSDRRSALFEVIPRNGVSTTAAQLLARQCATWQVPGLHLAVGGEARYYDDIDDAVNRSFPQIVGFVVLTTTAVLFWVFRSWLLPVKALLMNALSVLCGYGAVTGVFQLGVGAAIFGQPGRLASIPGYVLIVIFCVLFGLSMDYEIFLLCAMRDVYERTGENVVAVVQGLATTGSIVTSAALVMVVVAGAFAWAEITVIKMIGLGLAVAVLVDATVIRILIVPAFMRLAGRWNWVPGKRVPHKFPAPR